MYSLEHVGVQVGRVGQALGDLVENRRFANTVHAAEDVYFPVKVPYYVPAATPQRVYLDSLDVINEFFHCRLRF